MANTTFNGPVRSENGFDTISIASGTGVVTVEADYNIRPNFRVSVDNSTFAGAGGATDTLTRQESGTTFIVNGIFSILYKPSKLCILLMITSLVI